MIFEPAFARLLAEFPLISTMIFVLRHSTNQGDLAHLFAFHNAISPQSSSGGPGWVL